MWWRYERMKIIEFRNVGYEVAESGGERQSIIKDLSFTVEQGERLILLGQSGCGKTTTLRLINRLLPPTSGEIFVEGRPTTAWNAIELRRRIGYCIQESGLFPHFTVERNIATVPLLEGWTKERIHNRTEELLGIVGLASREFAGRFPQELSGGQRQRVGVARALAADPAILILDEPFGALDPLTRDELQNEFLLICENLGKTIVLVTHDVREALRLGTRIALMHQGQIELLATPAEFLASTLDQARRYRMTMELN
jgi:osmoprotectant transport system ATP-binding protein